MPEETKQTEAALAGVDRAELLEKISNLTRARDFAQESLIAIECWRTDAHSHDDEMGFDRRSFDDTDWESMEEYARERRQELMRFPS